MILRATANQNRRVDNAAYQAARYPERQVESEILAELEMLSAVQISE
jgi:hypothetical protein